MAIHSTHITGLRLAERAPGPVYLMKAIVKPWTTPCHAANNLFRTAMTVKVFGLVFPRAFIVIMQ